ncbi:MAG: 4Fe-4S single cluster domain-containing protein [Myxococcota bacterium]
MARHTQTPLLDVTGRRLNMAVKVPCTEAEGPGKRFAVWVQGCTMRCPGCCNPEMLVFEDRNWVDVDALAQEILLTHTNEGIEGVTFLGGEPFAQAPALAQLARRVRVHGLSVMIFSGYTHAHLTSQAEAGEPGVKELLAQVDLLVDGQFERDNLDHDRRWIGSQNQTTHALTSRYTELVADWDTTPNTLEIRLVDGQLMVNGSPFLMDKLGRVRKIF